MNFNSTRNDGEKPTLARAIYLAFNEFNSERFNLFSERQTKRQTAKAFEREQTQTKRLRTLALSNPEKMLEYAQSERELNERQLNSERLLWLEKNVMGGRGKRRRINELRLMAQKPLLNNGEWIK